MATEKISESSGLGMGRAFYRSRVSELEARLKTFASPFTWEYLNCREELELRRLQWMQLDRRSQSLFKNKSV